MVSCRFGRGLLIHGLFLSTLLVGLTACSKEVEGDREVQRSGGAADERPNVVLIVMDTVRQSRLSAYGYERQTSPFLEQLKLEARTYTRAYSVSNWTTPSHASMFTGLYPIMHLANQENWTLRQDLRTVAEILTAVGYETVGLIGNPMIGRHYQFDQGFEAYFEAWRGDAVEALGLDPGAADLPTVDERIALRWKRVLRQRQGNRPLFAFINLIGAHTPYDSCRPFCEEWLADPENMSPDDIPDAHWTFAKYYAGETQLSAEEIRQMGDLYDAELKKVDQIVSRILHDLDERGMGENTLVILTSDHGESLGDHGHVGHLFTLYDTLSRVPLMVRFPADARFERGSTDDTLAQLTDVFPTLLAAAGVDPEMYGSQGIHLAEVEARAKRPGFLELYRPYQVFPTYFSGEMPEEQRERVAVYDRRLRAIIKDGFKLILGSDGTESLFHLPSDPGELRDLASDAGYADRLSDLKEEVEALASKYGEGAVDRTDGAAETEIDSETIENLKKLGYI